MDISIVILTPQFAPANTYISRHVESLAKGISEKGIETIIISYHHEAMFQESGNIKIWRVPCRVRAHNILSFASILNVEFIRVVSDIINSGKNIDLINFHEWLTVQSAVSLKKTFRIPIIFSVYSLEDHRSSESNMPLNLSIKSLEELAVKESDKIIVQTEWMKYEVSRIYRAPLDKISVISPLNPNWIDLNLKVYEEVLKLT